MAITKIEYELLDETKCGDEPLSILLSGCNNKKEIALLAKALVRLVRMRCLECSSDDNTRPSSIKLTLKDLRTYLEIRERHGESLEEYPEHCPEYHFQATDLGIGHLRPEDRPIPLKDVRWVNGRAYPKEG